MQMRKAVDEATGDVQVELEVSLKLNANADKDGRMTLPAPGKDDPLWTVDKMDHSKTRIELRQRDGGFLNLAATVEHGDHVISLSGTSGRHREVGAYSEAVLLNGDLELVHHNLDSPLLVTVGASIALRFVVRELVPPVAKAAVQAEVKVIRPISVEE